MVYLFFHYRIKNKEVDFVLYEKPYTRLVKLKTSADENAQPFEHIEHIEWVENLQPLHESIEPPKPQKPQKPLKPPQPLKPQKPQKPQKPLKPQKPPQPLNTFDYLKINIIFVIPILRIQISYQRKIT